MKLKLILSFLFLSTLFSCNGQPNSSIEQIVPIQFKKSLETTKNAILIDVRTPEEFAVEHIENAININWNASSFEGQATKIDKNKTVFVYCKSGGRSAKASAKLHELGFKNILDLKGGILKWNAEGLGKPISKKIGMTLDDFKKLTQKEKPVLIDFYAQWCGPCKKMAPFLEKMKISEKNKLEIIKIDADQHKSLCEELKIESLPTLLYYKNSKEVWKHLGFITEKNLKTKITNVK